MDGVRGENERSATRDGIFACNEEWPRGVSMARKFGLNLPGIVESRAFDDAPVRDHDMAELTTVRQRSRAMARIAADHQPARAPTSRLAGTRSTHWLGHELIGRTSTDRPSGVMMAGTNRRTFWQRGVTSRVCSTAEVPAASGFRNDSVVSAR